MSNYTCVHLLGRLTRDPVMKTTNSGVTMCEIGFACSRAMKDGEEKPMFIDVVFFGKTAEAVDKHFYKGKPIFIRGSLELDMWEGQDGSKRSKHKVIGQEFSFVGKKDEQPPDHRQRDDEAPVVPEAAPF